MKRVKQVQRSIACVIREKTTLAKPVWAISLILLKIGGVCKAKIAFNIHLTLEAKLESTVTALASVIKTLGFIS